jgi:molecular chaperone Hsp33
VRFGPAIDAILSRHRYPPPVAKLLGEAIVLTVLLGSTLKFEGRFILQTQSDGPVRMLVIDYTTPGNVRGCARFDAKRVDAAIAAGAADGGALLGRGHLAMTIDQGPDTARYQGIVPLEGKSLEHAAHEYALGADPARLAVAEVRCASGAHHRWRAGGLLPQFCRSRRAPAAPTSIRRRARRDGGAGGDRGRRLGRAARSRASRTSSSRSRHIGGTAALPAVQRARRAFFSRDLQAQCSCSRDRVERMLRSFPDDRDHMVENGDHGHLRVPARPAFAAR